jgi:tRNA A-37 threonylcarbamoyl transferase component Bud32
MAPRQTGTRHFLRSDQSEIEFMAEPGTLRISHYRVEQELSRDSLGYFFRALDEQLDRSVVLRVARAGQLFEGDELATFRARIREQARAAAQISHPNLVTIHEFRALSETDLVVMELVEGETLEGSRRSGQRWTVLDVARLLARVADALAGAHAVGLIHGNVNSANIRVRPDGRVKLLDLGIPKLELLGQMQHSGPADDIRALARVACDLLAPPLTEELPAGATRRDPLADPVLGRAQFGFLAPVLARAIRDPRGFESAGAFRDALLLAMDMATGRGAGDGDLESGFGTHPVGPSRPSSGEDSLPPDSRTLAPMGRLGPRLGPRLALPPDLLERATDLESVEMFEVRPIPHQKTGFFDRLLERAGAPVMIGGVFVIAAILIAVLLMRREDSSPPGAVAPDSSQMQVAGIVPPDETGAAVDSQMALSGNAGAAVPVSSSDSTPASAPAASPSSANVAPLFTAWVRARPAGTRIRVIGQDGAWRDTVELSVPAGDTLNVEFSRPGYLTQRLPFTGSRLAVSLQPDSVIAEFDANVEATVFLDGEESTERLGTTPLVTRLPTGTHRILYRAPGQPDWETAQRMPRAGQTYRVNKGDYVTVGNLIATVPSSWGMVSVDGGAPVETPARFTGLSAGQHIVRITREGFQTITDTVIVPANQTLRRQYTLRR